MTKIPGRTIEDLKFIYERNPNRRDIYVEGTYDASILKWVIQECELTSAAIYEIATVEIDDGRLLAMGRKANNRERVIFLAEYIGRDQNHCNQITCLVDADFSHLSGEFSQITCLIYTDYSCMEMYLFNEYAVGKFLTLYCKKGDWPVRDILTSIGNVLQELFLYRFANDKLEWGMDWLDNTVCVALQGWKINFDSNDYVVRFLNKNGRAGELAKFSSQVDVLRPLMKQDARYQMHGHDFIQLLCWFLRQKGLTEKVSNREIVERSLAVSANYEGLRNENAIRQLISRVL